MLLPITHSELDPKIYFAFAVPSWLDIGILNALLKDLEQGEIAMGMACSSMPLPITEIEHITGRYKFDDDKRKDLLTILRNEHTSLCVELNKRAFTYFAQQILSGKTEQEYEDALFEHLEILFQLYIGAQKLPELNEVLTQAEQLSLSQISHQLLRDYYRGCWYNQGGDSEQQQAAESIFEQILKASQDNAEADRYQLRFRARVLNALGINYNYQERFDKAIEIYGQAAVIYAELGEPQDKRQLAAAISNQGIANHQLGKYEEALPLFTNAYEVAKDGNDRHLYGRILMNLGYTFHQLSEWDKAKALYQEALSIWKEVGNSDMAARVYNNLGELSHLRHLLDDFNDYPEQAKGYFEKALSILLESAIQNNPDNVRDTADIMLNLGFLFYTQNEWDDAQRQYDIALKFAEGLKNRTIISQIYYRLGELFWKNKNNWSKAKEFLQNAVFESEKMLRQVDKERTRISVLGIRHHTYDALIRLCFDLTQQADNDEKKALWAEALTYVEQARARAFLDRLNQLDLHGDLPVEKPLSTSEIQERLQADQALIEFFVTGTRVPTTEAFLKKLPANSLRLKELLTQPEELYVFVVNHNNIFAYQVNFEMQRLRKTFFNDSDGRLKNIGSNVESLPPLGTWHGLYEKLFSPLLPYLQDKQHIFLVAHDLLHYLPLHALSRHGSITEHEVTVSYAPSTSILFKGILA